MATDIAAVVPDLNFLDSVVMYFAHTLSAHVPMESMTYHLMKTTGHPVVQYCKSLTTCGPFQLAWEFSLKRYNDATALQQSWFPIVKLVIVLVNWTGILIALLIPVMDNWAKWEEKFKKVMDKGHGEWNTVQSESTAAANIPAPLVDKNGVPIQI